MYFMTDWNRIRGSNYTKSELGKTGLWVCPVHMGGDVIKGALGLKGHVYNRNDMGDNDDCGRRYGGR